MSSKKQTRTSTPLLYMAIAGLAVGCGGSEEPPDDIVDPPTGVIASAAWVKQNIIDNDNNGNPYVIVEFSYGVAGDYYNDGHIPGAIHVNSDEIEYDCFNARSTWPVDPGAPPCYDRSTTEEEDAAKGLGVDDSLPRNFWNLYPDEYLLPAIAHMGIDTNTTVVVYAFDPAASARLVMALRYAGVSEVYLMDGGINAWTAAGYEVETEPTARVPVADFGRATPAAPAYFVDTAYAQDVVAGNVANAVFADVRTNDEYTGTTAPYDYVPTDGRIEGAIYTRGSIDGPYDMKYVVNEDSSLKPLGDIETMWREDGLVPDQQKIIFYCGTGWRAALTFLIAEALGWNDIAYYEGGWMEWSMGADATINPIEDDEPTLP